MREVIRGTAAVAVLFIALYAAAVGRLCDAVLNEMERAGDWLAGERDTPGGRTPKPICERHRAPKLRR